MTDFPLHEIDRIEAANASYAANFDRGGRPVRPRRALVVVTCMDSRMDLFSLLGLEVGDAHLIRNAGGIVTDDVIRSISLSQRALGTRGVVLVHHTNCGLEGVDDAEFAALVRDDAGREAPWKAGGFSDVYDDTRRSIRAIQESPFLLHREAVFGYVYDVETGLLGRVG